MFAKRDTDKKWYCKMKNKKALAPIVATVILIALVLAVVAIIWGIVNNIVKGGLEESEACFGVFDKVSLNSEYTCYINDDFRFSISIGDIDVDEILVGISAEGNSATFRISKTPSEIDNLVMYPSGSTDIQLPGKDAGYTYVFNMTGAGFSENPDSISIAPVVSGTQCSVSDSMNQIERC